MILKNFKSWKMTQSIRYKKIIQKNYIFFHSSFKDGVTNLLIYPIERVQSRKQLLIRNPVLLWIGTQADAACCSDHDKRSAMCAFFLLDFDSDLHRLLHQILVTAPPNQTVTADAVTPFRSPCLSQSTQNPKQRTPSLEKKYSFSVYPWWWTRNILTFCYILYMD